MISGARAAPVEVGVWIPKAKLGPTADYFRPLECQYLRQASRWHHCCSNHESNLCIYAPSQVVMNCFKEPQHAVNAIQTLLDSDVPMAALLVDLSKAFERVNPSWILHILQMRVRRRGMQLCQICFIWKAHTPQSTGQITTIQSCTCWS